MACKLASALACLVFCLAGIFACGVRSASAQAADAALADKSGFTLFNPTPDDEMRAFMTDRPGRSNTPMTVDAGHFQYGTDLFFSSFANSGGVSTRLFTVADPVFKLGVTNTTDLELALGGYQSFRQSISGTATVLHADGFGDTVLRVKQNLFGNDGGFAALAVIPYVKLPTSSRNLGNNQVEGGVIATLQLNLPLDLSLILMSEFDILKNATNGGKHGNSTNLVSLGHSIYGDLSGSIEFVASVGTDAGTPAAQTFDVTLSYALTPNLQLDAAFYAGLDKGAPARTAYMGLSQRF
jgi:hypothetical protein